MSDPAARLTLVTLGVSDLERSVSFYEKLGFQRRAKAAGGVAFFQAGAMAFAVFPSAELARDADVPVESREGGFRGVALAWNCATKTDVDQAIARAKRAGAVIRKTAQDAFWGGYLGYFTDPDGHLWEVTFNPDFPLSEDGRLLIPD